MNADEEEVKQHLPIQDDKDMRMVFGNAQLRSAAMAILKRNLRLSGGDACLVEIRTALFSENYQLKRCLADRGGGAKSEVRMTQSRLYSIWDSGLPGLANIY